MKAETSHCHSNPLTFWGDSSTELKFKIFFSLPACSKEWDFEFALRGGADRKVLRRAWVQPRG